MADAELTKWPVISAGHEHSTGVKSDRTAVACGNDDNGQVSIVSDFTDLKSIHAGEEFTVGLTNDGTVVGEVKYLSTNYGTPSWENIEMLAAGKGHLLGLHSDGTVEGIGYNYDGQIDVGAWTDVIFIAAGGNFSLGLQSDGTIIGTGQDYGNQITNAPSDPDFVAIAAGIQHALALSVNGTVIGWGDSSNNCIDVSGWSNIAMITAGNYTSYGLKEDGSIEAVGLDGDNQVSGVSAFSNILSISSSYKFVLALDSDQTVHGAGVDLDNQVSCVGAWEGIAKPEGAALVVIDFVPQSVVYKCVLTGEADGLDDLILPMSSFQARLRNGSPTYCEVSIPGMSYMDAISARPNGAIIISIGLYKAGADAPTYTELVTVDLDGAGFGKGPRNQSIVISGTRTTSNASPETVEAKNVEVLTLQKDGRYQVRCDVDWEAKPGGTLQYVSAGVSFTIGLITIIVGPQFSTMYITEAAA